MLKRMLLALALLSLMTRGSYAGAGELVPGARVRLMTTRAPGQWSKDAYSFRGTLVRSDRDSITLRPIDEEPVTYARPDRWLAGTLVAVEPASLVVATSGGHRLRVPRVALTRLQVGAGGSRGIGVLKGAGVGLAAGAIAGFASGDDEPGWFALTAGQKAAMLGTLGAGIGAVVGLLAGGGTGWHAVETEHVRVSLAPAGPATARVTLRF